jgi:hypothetical protein
MLVDFMHEFELGSWRGLLIHLIRILVAHDPSLVIEFDRRCVSNPSSSCHNLTSTAFDKYQHLVEVK